MCSFYSGCCDAWSDDNKSCIWDQPGLRYLNWIFDGHSSLSFPDLRYGRGVKEVGQENQERVKLRSTLILLMSLSFLHSHRLAFR